MLELGYDVQTSCLNNEILFHVKFFQFQNPLNFVPHVKWVVHSPSLPSLLSTQMFAMARVRITFLVMLRHVSLVMGANIVSRARGVLGGKGGCKVM